MLNVLWLVSWYPSPLAPFEGDFIQRHARAVSLYCKVEVIFVKKDVDGIMTTGVSEQVNVTGNLTERTIFYKPSVKGLKWADRYMSNKKYRQCFKDAVHNYIHNNGKPQFVHVHIAYKAGLIALWMKKTFDIPFIITEHSTAFLPDAVPNLQNLPGMMRSYVKKIFASAGKVTVVSKVLGDAISMKFPVKGYHVIPNVVDTNVFLPGMRIKNSCPQFIHVSTLVYQKER